MADDPAPMPPATMLELTAGELLPEHVGRVLHIPQPPVVGVLLELEQHVTAPPVRGRVVMTDATRLLLERPRAQRGGLAPAPLPVHLLPTVRVVVDLALDVGECDLCGQDLLRTSSDCWHPWTVERACPPEPPLHAWPPGFRSGRPGRDHWRPRTTTTPEDS